MTSASKSVIRRAGLKKEKWLFISQESANFKLQDYRDFLLTFLPSVGNP